MSKPSVSIIVPVYNTEAYLGQCLDSVLGQTLSDIEVICVDNGSTDGSLQILRNYADHDPRVTVIVHPEGRLGGARNAGLRRATGEYIGFVDSDDFIDAEMYRLLYSCSLRHDADLGICGITTYLMDDGAFAPKEPEILGSEECTSIAANRLLFRNLTAWNKLYRREFIERNCFLFPEDTFYEDQVYVPRAYMLANRIAVVSRPCYYYRKQRPGQISTLTDDRIFDIFQILAQLDAFAQERKLIPDLLQDIGELKIQSLLYLFRYTRGQRKRVFFNEMKGVFERVTVQSPLHFISRTHYNNARIVKACPYATAVTLLALREYLGRLLRIPLIRALYLRVRR